MESETCPSTLFDRHILQPCNEYIYENTHSVAYDVSSQELNYCNLWQYGSCLTIFSLFQFGLACDEWKRSLIGTVRTFGTLTALPITGYVSDRWGRRVALTLNAFNTAWLGAVRYWSDTYFGFMISEFIEATFGSGGFSTIYILCK